MTLKIGVLGSGEGSEIHAIINAAESGRLDAEIVSVISDVEDAPVLELARNHGIESIFMEYSGNRGILFDKAAAKEFDRRGAEVIVLAGFARQLSSWFCKHYENRIMDMHPSLLPLFAGNPRESIHQEVLNSGVKVTGPTLHFVTSGKGGGPIIMQKPVMVEDGDTPETLGNKVSEAGNQILLESVKLFGEGRIKIEGNRVKIL